MYICVLNALNGLLNSALRFVSSFVRLKVVDFPDSSESLAISPLISNEAQRERALRIELRETVRISFD